MQLGPTETCFSHLANTLVFFSANPTVTLFRTAQFLHFDDLLRSVVIFFIGHDCAIFIISAISTAASLSREDRVASRAKALQERISNARPGKSSAPHAKPPTLLGILHPPMPKSTGSCTVFMPLFFTRYSPRDDFYKQRFRYWWQPSHGFW